MVKILAIGDPHFRVDNIKEVEEFTTRTVNLIRVEKPDFVVCLGDLLHTHERVHTFALNKAYDFIKQISDLAKIFVLVGNHDYIQNQQFLSTNHWMNAMKFWDNVEIVDSVISRRYSDLTFIFSPYVPNGRFIEALDTLKDSDWKRATCIFAHQEFYGCKMGAIISVDGDRWDLAYPRVISGHIHSKQRPQENIYYTGSSLQHAFGENEDNTVSMVEFSDQSGYRVTEHDLGLPKKRIVYTSMDDIGSSKVREKINENTKLAISGDDYNEFKAFKKTNDYKQLVEKGAKVVFKLKEQPRVEMISNDEDKIENNFKSILYGLCSDDNQLIRMYNLVINNVDEIKLEIIE